MTSQRTRPCFVRVDPVAFVPHVGDLIGAHQEGAQEIDAQLSHAGVGAAVSEGMAVHRLNHPFLVHADL